MTSSESQGNPALTRKQLRELRETGSVPLPAQDAAPAELPAPAEQAEDSAPVTVFETPRFEVPAFGEPQLDEPEHGVPTFEVGGLFEPVADAAPKAEPGAEPEVIAEPEPDFFPVPDVVREQAPIAEPEASVPEEPVAEPEPVAVESAAPEATLSRRELRELQTRRAQTAEVRVETPVEPGDVSEPITAEQLTLATTARHEDEPFQGGSAHADTTGSQHAAPSALIFDQTPGPLTLAGPLSSDGGVMITGSFELPDGLGSRGHAEGSTDGRDVDAVLLDRELAASSSPAPVAASSAISTIKPAGEVMRQPAPEKGGKLLMGLAITAGALMVALTAALILAFTNNVF